MKKWLLMRKEIKRFNLRKDYQLIGKIKHERIWGRLERDRSLMLNFLTLSVTVIYLRLGSRGHSK